MTDTDIETSRRDIEKNALMNPWTPDELAAIEPFVNDPRAGAQVAEEAIKDTRLSRRNLNAVTQKIIGVRRQRGISQGGRTGAIAKADPGPPRSRRATASKDVVVSSPGQAVSVLVQAFESQSAVGRETVLALVDYMIRLQDPELAETAARVARALRGFPLKDRERILNAVAMVLEVQGPSRST